MSTPPLKAQCGSHLTPKVSITCNEVADVYITAVSSGWIGDVYPCFSGSIDLFSEKLCCLFELRAIRLIRSSEVAYYESVFIARPDITNVQVEAISESFKAIIAEHGGSATKDEYWGLRSLAYRIKKNRKGHYVMLNLDAPASAISELERNMRLNEDVIRFMTIKVDSLNEEPSVMMRNKTARDEKNRRDGFVEEQYSDNKVVTPTQKDQGEGQ